MCWVNRMMARVTDGKLDDVNGKGNSECDGERSRKPGSARTCEAEAKDNVVNEAKSMKSGTCKWQGTFGDDGFSNCRPWCSSFFLLSLKLKIKKKERGTLRSTTIKSHHRRKNGDGPFLMKIFRICVILFVKFVFWEFIVVTYWFCKIKEKFKPWTKNFCLKKK